MTTNTSETPEGTPRRRRSWRGPARAVVALAVLGALTTSVVQDVGGSVPPWFHFLGVDHVMAQADQTAAIQQVIQRSNDEQVQAIASGDPSAMTDTVTSDHYQQLQQVNQDLLDNGVTSISLVNLEWGPIAVSGSTATATTYETWSTTYKDGSTEQSRDQNAYTLVQVDGSWKIASDDHPQSASPAVAPPAGPSASTPPSTNLSVSHNWAGYAATGGGYTAVNGTWTVPDFSATSPQGVDATWVGIGGVNTRDLIQAGTQEMTSGSGQTQYQAWIEMLPQASRPVPLSVRPGDSVSVSITEQGTNTWLISFTNNTTGQTFQQAERYASSNSSAEWVEEAPSSGRGILPLDNFGSVQFSNASTVKNGQSEDLAAAGAQPISLIGPRQQPLAVPSAIGSDGSSFSVSRTATAATPQGVGAAPGSARSRGGFGL